MSAPTPKALTPRTIVLAQTGIAVADYVGSRHIDEHVELDPQQRACIDRITSTSRHFNVRGKAGCGKSLTMMELAGETPVAMTVDLFLQHKHSMDFTDQLKSQRPLAPGTCKSAPRIILEEIGQWSGSNFEMLSHALQKVCRNSLPFGGIQIVTCGDFAQLAPVGNDPVNTHPLWYQMNFETIELQVQHRQSNDEDDEEFSMFLDEVRRSTSSRTPLPAYAAGMLNYKLRCLPRGDFLGVTLTKNVCRERNWQRVHESDGPRYVVGDGRNFPNTFPNGGAVPLVPGCRIQITHNVWHEDGPREPSRRPAYGGGPVVLNGQFGHLVGFECKTPPAEITIAIGGVEKPYFLLDIKKKWTARVVMDCDGQEKDLSIVKIKDAVVDSTGETKMASKKILPFECAFWTRLHRLQGQTISEKMHIDFTGAISFEPACIYVGLSRAKRLRDISISNLDSFSFQRIVENGE